MNVLVVEDDPNLRALWGAVFGRVGHSCRLEETEEGARTALGEAHFDIVLLDLYLAGDKTIDIAALAGAMPVGSQIVVVTGTSAYSRGELFDMAPQVAAVLRKPVDIEDLISVCEHLDQGGGPIPPAIRDSATIETRG